MPAASGPRVRGRPAGLDSHVTPECKVVRGAAALAVTISLCGCSAATTPEEAIRPTSHATSSPTTTPTVSTAPDPDPSPTSVDPRDSAYLAEIAAWPEPLPPGFSWPESLTGTPAGEYPRGGDWDRYTTSAGIYHCMLVFAAWDAYFVENDPVAAKEYASRAQQTTPDVPYPNVLIDGDGRVRDQDLASESGVCNGFVGDLRG